MTPPLLEYEDVTIYRGERLALDRITLRIEHGEHVAILGPNGCGKSTFIKTLTRECYPYLENGPYTLRIMGEEVWDLFTLRAMLGIVTNDLVAACARPISGRQTVLSGFFSSIGVWEHHHVTPAMRRQADEILETLEIAHLADRNADELSSGELHRLVIARALVAAPKALVLDEPTNSLDIRSFHELREMIRRIAQRGTAIVLVTHHLADIIPEIDRVILLKNGRIAGDGPKDTVLTVETLSGLFGIPVEIVRRDGYYQLW